MMGALSAPIYHECLQRSIGTRQEETRVRVRQVTQRSCAFFHLAWAPPSRPAYPSLHPARRPREVSFILLMNSITRGEFYPITLANRLAASSRSSFK